MFNKVSGVISTIAMSSFVAFTPSIVSASEIALTFADNGLTIAGEFVGFKENAYVITTTVGELHVPAVLVTCEGADCLNVVIVRQDG